MRLNWTNNVIGGREGGREREGESRRNRGDGGRFHHKHIIANIVRNDGLKTTLFIIKYYIPNNEETGSR